MATKTDTAIASAVSLDRPWILLSLLIGTPNTAVCIAGQIIVCNHLEWYFVLSQSASALRQARRSGEWAMA